MKEKSIWCRAFVVWMILALMFCHGGGLAFAEMVPAATSQEQTVPTPDPTTAPTTALTPEPTAAPTAAPTPEPTAAPTAAPTPEPTAAPTAAPTPEPTTAPTAAPTETVTVAPMLEPTATPAATATAAPSEGTTLEPEAAPTEPTTEDPEPTTVEATEKPTSTSTTKPVNDPAMATPADSTDEPETIPAADPTGEPAASPIADPTDEPEETPAADLTDEPEETPAADLTDEPEETPTAEPTENEDESGKETEETEYLQTMRLDGILITVSAEKGVMGPEAELQISSSGNGDFTLAVEENLGTAEQEILYQRHQVYRISGTEPKGTLQIKMENMSLSSLQEQYPEGKVSVSVWRYDPEGKTASEQAKKLPASTRLQENTVAFSADRTGIYDVLSLVSESLISETYEMVETKEEDVPVEGTESISRTDETTENIDISDQGENADETGQNEDTDITEDAEKSEQSEKAEETEETGDTKDQSESEEQENAEVQSEAEESEDTEDTSEAETAYKFVVKETVSLGGSADLGDLFEQYVLRELPSRSRGIRLMAANPTRNAGSLLVGCTHTLYETLATQAAAVAKGECASTVFTYKSVDLDCSNSHTAKNLGITEYSNYWDENGNIVSENAKKELVSLLVKKKNLSVKDAVSALISDYPYDVYWMDRSDAEAEYEISITLNANNEQTRLAITNCTFRLPVGLSYRLNAEDPYSFNTALPARVTTAKNRILKIIQDHEGLSTYQQLAGFKQAICNLVEYNSSPDKTDSDSWQLINIFDGDPATTVNSNGYAKGFKYLCDLAGIPCITMTGTVTAPQEAAHSHTWNVVRLTVNSVDKYYPVDLANADFGRPGYPDKVFLHGSGYTYDPETKTKAFTFNVSGGTLSYAVITDDPDDAEGKAWIGWSATSYLYDLNTGNTIYEIEIISGEHGSVEASPSAAEEGKLVTLTVTPLEGYELDTLVAATEDETTVTIAEGTGGIYTFTMPAGKVILTAAWKTKTEAVYAQIKGVSGSFNDRIKLNFYFDIPQEILADQGAYVALTNTRKGSTVNRPIKDAEYVEGKGYKFSLAMVPVESGDNICAKLYDGTGAPITVKGSSGSDYTATGVSKSLDEYMSWLAGNGGSSDERALASAAMDYCAAAKIYFGKNAEGASIKADLSGITVDTLTAFNSVASGEIPEGITLQGMTLMIESDNTLRLYLNFSDVNPDECTYTIDGNPAALKKTGHNKGYLATKSGIYSNKLQVSHVYGISKGEKTYSMTASVLTYARAAISSEKETLQQLGRTLYRYNQAAIKCFGQ